MEGMKEGLWKKMVSQENPMEEEKKDKDEVELKIGRLGRGRSG